MAGLGERTLSTKQLLEKERNLRIEAEENLAKIVESTGNDLAKSEAREREAKDQLKKKEADLRKKEDELNEKDDQLVKLERAHRLEVAKVLAAAQAEKSRSLNKEIQEKEAWMKNSNEAEAKVRKLTALLKESQKLNARNSRLVVDFFKYIQSGVQQYDGKLKDVEKYEMEVYRNFSSNFDGDADNGDDNDDDSNANDENANGDIATGTDLMNERTPQGNCSQQPPDCQKKILEKALSVKSMTTRESTVMTDFEKLIAIIATLTFIGNQHHLKCPICNEHVCTVTEFKDHLDSKHIAALKPKNTKEKFGICPFDNCTEVMKRSNLCQHYARKHEGKIPLNLKLWANSKESPKFSDLRIIFVNDIEKVVDVNSIEYLEWKNNLS